MVKIMNFIGIRSREDLIASYYKTIKEDLVKKGILPHLNIFYSIEMGLQDRRWNEITLEEKKEIQNILNTHS